MQRYFISLSEEVTDRVSRQAIRAHRPVRQHLEYLVEIAAESLETTSKSVANTPEEVGRVSTPA